MRLSRRPSAQFGPFNSATRKFLIHPRMIGHGHSRVFGQLRFTTAALWKRSALHPDATLIRSEHLRPRARDLGMT